jgi:CelD/BcsL family acetyltransferase involved in cellulose biosynthesis
MINPAQTVDSTHQKGETENKVFVSLISPQEVQILPALRNEWDRLLEVSNNIELLFQSPQWFEHLMATNPDDNRMFLGIIKDNTGKCVGMVPIRIDKYTLSFDISSYMLWKIRLRTASILGSQPLIPQDENIYKHLFTTLLKAFPEIQCIYMGSVPVDSLLWQYVTAAKGNREYWIPQVVGGVQTHHALLLPATFEEYLSKLKRKKRYNLQRQVKLLQDHGGGGLELLRVESEDHISLFLEAAFSIAKNSWQHKRLGTRIDNSPEWHSKLQDLAGRGLLRAYYLKYGGKPCAFALGYQFRDVYHYVEIAYDESFAKYSPGTVLLYLLIKDLIQHHPPKRLNFGLSDHPYKQMFGNIHFKAAQILLWRSTFPNRIKRTSHLAFRGGISLIKTYLHKRKSPLAGEET